jgi:hypothetical protein
VDTELAASPLKSRRIQVVEEEEVHLSVEGLGTKRFPVKAVHQVLLSSGTHQRKTVHGLHLHNKTSSLPRPPSQLPTTQHLLRKLGFIRRPQLAIGEMFLARALHLTMNPKGFLWALMIQTKCSWLLEVQ